MRIDRVAPPLPDTIVHEMTHAVQDLELGYPFTNERREEGQAFAVESFYRLGIELKNKERALYHAGCSPGPVAAVWKNLWKYWGIIPNEKSWGPVRWSNGEDLLNKQDLFEIYDIFGVRLKCPAIAQVVNGILAEHHCCFAVTCSGDDTSTEIGPGVQIDPFFQ
jgi:hypothetical protein